MSVAQSVRAGVAAAVLRGLVPAAAAESVSALVASRLDRTDETDTIGSTGSTRLAEFVPMVPLLAGAARHGGGTGQMTVESMPCPGHEWFRQFVFATQSLFGVRCRVKAGDGQEPRFLVAGEQCDVRAFRTVAAAAASLLDAVFDGVDVPGRARLCRAAGLVLASSPDAHAAAEAAATRFEQASLHMGRVCGPAATLSRTG